MDCYNTTSDDTNDTIEEEICVIGTPDEREGEWYFESDHPRLKANPDYNKLLKTLAILEAQRIQTLEDHAALGKIKEDALKDPIPFMEKMLNGKDVGFPIPVKIAEIPRIDWSLYRHDRRKDMRPRRRLSQTSGASCESHDSVKGTISCDCSCMNIKKINKKGTCLCGIQTRVSSCHMLGNANLINTVVKRFKKIMMYQSANDVRSMHTLMEPSGLDANTIGWTQSDGKSNAILVRGRAYDNSKPVTFNQLWTEEEQQRLEELLVEFPSEEVEQNRYKKIATALGNRTPQQVSSRIQKYFIKLYRAGLPIPGRSPRMGALADTRASRHHHQKYNRMLFRPTTFFPQMAPLMGSYNLEYQLTPHGEIVQNYLDTNGSQEDFDSEDELLKLLGDADEIIDLPEKLVEAKHTRILRLLAKVKEDKHRKVDVVPKHYGYKCCYCNDDPLEGTRWHCQTCHCTVGSVDYCTDCVVTQLESSCPHPISHRLVPISTTYWMSTGYDQDYAPPAFAGGDVDKYNYLDPNFLPS